MDLTGQTLGKYKLIRRLGKGGMAQVYQANQPTIERMVAVKVLHSHLAESDDFVARFKREARGLGQLQHPHIVQVIDFDTAKDMYYMVMDYIPGKTLRSYLDEKVKLSNSEALTLIAQLTNALAYAHKKGMIHRDIKPANVMFSDDSCTHAILTDFGITRLLNEKSITVTGAMVGTPAYMSPEAVLGEDIDDRSDIYSLGVILYEMLSGRTPYEGNTPLSLVIKQVHEPLPSLLEIDPDLPIDIVQIIEKSLAKSADDRYQSADEFLEAVQAAQMALGERPFGSTVISATRRMQSEAETLVPEAETAVPEPETAVKPSPSPISTNRWPLYAGLGVLALLIIAGGIWFSQREPSDNDGVVNLPTATIASTETAVVEATATTIVEAVVDPTQTVAPTVVEEATAVPTETPIPPTPTAEPIPLVVPEQMGALRFVGNESLVADTVLLQIDRVLLPAADFHYALWFETPDGLLNGGVLTVENGRIRATVTLNENLISQIQQVVVSLEPDSNPANATEIVGDVVYVGELPSAYTAVLQQLLNDDGLLLNAQAQAQIARQHAGFTQDALDQNNLTEAKVHAEHVLNILDGETGERFGDVNLDGQAQNPGNGVGVRAYLVDSREQITSLQQNEPITQNRIFFTEQAVLATDNSSAIVEDAMSAALSLQATDTVAEAEPFATAVIELLERLLSTDASQQTIIAAANHAFALAQLPMLATDGAFPVPDAIVDTVPGRVGTLQLGTADGLVANAFLLQLNQLPAPSVLQEYAAWVRNSETDSSRFLGVVDVINGQAELVGNATENLLLAYDELLITLQPVEQGEVLDVETAVYAGTLHSDLGLAILRLIADDTSDEPGSLFNAQAQLQIALQHQQFAVESLAASNLTEAKIHTEHVINILDGEDGDHFGDLNLDGQAQNPGDGVGVRGYWVRAVNEVIALGELTNVTPDQEFYGERLIATAETGTTAILDAIEQGQKLLASDTVEEAQPFLDEMRAALNRVSAGTDIDNNGVIDPLLGEGGFAEALDLLLAIHEVSVFPQE